MSAQASARRSGPVTHVPVAISSGALAMLLTACPADAETSAKRDPAPAATPSTDSAEYRRQAHQRALQRFLDAAQAAGVLLDPVSAHVLGLSALAPRPLSRTAREPVRRSVHSALSQAEGIDGHVLSPEDRMLFRAVRTTLEAAKRELDERPALRRDPTVLAPAIEALLDQVSLRLRDRLTCSEGVAALGALGDELPRLPGLIGATSNAALHAARSDLNAIGRRITALGSVPVPDCAATVAKGVTSARAGVDAIAKRLDEIAARIETAPSIGWGTPIAGATAAVAVQRLPDRIGAEEFARRLADEEALRLAPRELADQITLVLGRLDGMGKQLPAHDPASDAAKPGSPARCQSAWAPIEAWATSNDGFASAFDCSREGEPLAAVTSSDAARTLALFERGVLHPTRDRDRRSVVPALALSQGRMAAAGQHLAVTVSGLTHAQANDAAHLAIEGARAALCGALAATLEHAEIGTAAGRRARLEEHCPDHDPAALVQDALARPRAALAPAGMVLMNEGPAAAVALSRFWWVPAGLVVPLADPHRASAPEKPVQPHIEPLPGPRSDVP